MPRLFWSCLAAALIAAGPALAAAPSESAEQNVRESAQYERLLCTNPSFRAKRMAQECGPLTDRQMHDNCVASFQCGASHRRSNQAPPSEMIR